MPPDYTIVLDAAAVIAFTQHSRAVGETLAEIQEEGNAFCVPPLCLGNTMRVIGDDTDAINASITWHALAGMAYILTDDPDRYLHVHPALQTIRIEEPADEP